MNHVKYSQHYGFRQKWWRLGVTYHCADIIEGYKLLFWGGFRAEWLNLWWRINQK